MSQDPVTLDRSGQLATITLSRPDDANSIDLPLAEGLRAAVAEADADENLRALVIRGSGRFFCAGGDVAAIFAAADPTGYLIRLTDAFHEALMHLSSTSLTVIAAVNGTVAGGGLGLLLNCDLSVSVPKASFVGAYSSIGLTPDSGVSTLLPRAIGDRRARSLLLGGRVLDAVTAEAWGLVGEVAETEDFDEHVARLVRSACAGSRAANGETKRLLAASWNQSYGAQLTDEGRTIAAMSAADASRELIGAFLAQRINR